jgi:hypothetical protein
MSDSKFNGGCQCGAVRYEIVGEPIMAALCHCSMCRRANAAPMVAWAMFAESQVAFTNAQPKSYASSPDAQRGFCGTCGTQICFTAEYIPGLIDITVGSFDQPDSIKPELHYWYDEHLSWVEFQDGLPRHPQFPPMGDG